MMKRRISAVVKEVIDGNISKFMRQCEKCSHFFPKGSFCQHCELEKEAKKALRKAH